MGNFTPSDEQRMIINAPYRPGLNIVIAYAGCGKTTVLEHLCRNRPGLKILYIVFNKSAQQDAQKRFPDHVTVKTMNGLAYHAETADKLRDRIAEKMNWTLFVDELENLQKDSAKRITLAQRALAVFEAWCASAQRVITMDIYPDEVLTAVSRGIVSSEVINAAATQILRSMYRGKADNVSHSLYLKLFQLSKPRLDYDVILVDEAQDLNPVVTDIINNQPHAEQWRVGDPYQGIYEFRGASDAGMKSSDATYYYLTNTFRFGPQIAEVASTVIQTYRGAGKPIVGRGQQGYISYYKKDKWGDHDNPEGRKQSLKDLWLRPEGEGAPMLLARTKAGMVSLLVDRCITREEARENYQLAQQGKSIKRTDDAGNEYLLDTLDGPEDVIYMPGGFNSYGFSELMDAWSLFKGTPRGSMAKYRNWLQFEDTAEATESPADMAIMNLINRYKGLVPTVIMKAKNMTTTKADKATVIITTAHKSKGLEAERVFINDDFPNFPSSEGNKVIGHQEIHLAYVAITRAEKQLYAPPQIKWIAEGEPVPRLEITE